MAEASHREKEVFSRALELSSASERDAYVAMACGSDELLRRQVEALLAAHSAGDSFLEKPAGALGVTVDAADKIVSATGETVGDPGRRVGSYKLLEQIGAGGMGAVYMAEQLEPVRRVVALKIIKPGMDSAQVLARFEAERQALAMMDHPNIAKVLDAGATAAGRPFFVMELVKGTPITAFCDANKLSPRRRLELFIPVCQAIQHAHQKGVIHRDIKPSNVLIALYDDKPVPKVIDFGIAKAAGQPLTERTLHTGFGAVVGTPEYMSPEQATFNQLDIDTRSDVYSLGVLLYELLTGSTPVDTTGLKEAALLEVLRVVREEEPERPSVKLSTTAARASIAATRGTGPDELARFLRGELDWIVMKSLEKDRNRRYESAASLARDVDRFLKDELVEARPPSTRYRLRKAIKRHRGKVLAASLLFLALLGGVIGTSIGLVRAWTAEAETDLVVKELDQMIVMALEQVDEAEESEAKAKEAKEQVTKALARSEGMRLLLQAELTRPHNPGLALLLGMEGAERYPGLLANNTLLAALDDNRKERTLVGQKGPLCFSADGRRLLTVSKEGPICLWEVQTGKQVVEFQKLLVKNETDALTSQERYGDIMFHPDGKRVLTSGWRGRACLWDASTGKAVCFFEDASDAANKPSLGVFNAPPRFSPDGRFVLTCQGAARLWDIASGKQHLVLTGHEGRVNWAEFSRDGKQIITASRDKTARIWDTESGKQLHVVKGMPYEVMTACMSPDGQRVLTLDRELTDGDYRLWDVRTGKQIAALGSAVDSIFFAAPLAHFSPDGRYICTPEFHYSGFRFGELGRMRLNFWDASTGAHLHQIKEHSFDAATAFSPDGRLVMTIGSRDLGRGQGIELRDTRTFQVSQTLRGHDIFGTVTAAAFSPDGEYLATADLHGVHLWAIAGAAERRLGRWSSFLAVSPDGRRLATRSTDPQEVAVWEISTGQGIARFRGKETAEVNFARFSLDGRRIIFGGRPEGKKGSACVGDMATGQLTAILPGHDDDLFGADLSPDGRWAVTSTQAHGRIWDLATGKEHARWSLSKDGERWIDARFSPDGRWLVTVPSGAVDQGPARARIRDAMTGKQVAVLNPDDTEVAWDGSAVFSRDSTRVLSWNAHSSTGGANVWDSATGKVRAISVGKKHLSQIVDAAFSDDGQFIVTCDKHGKTARIWQTATGKEMLALAGHDDAVTAASFSSDNEMIVTASADQTVRLWSFRTGEPLSVFRGHAGIVQSARFISNSQVLSVDINLMARVWPTDPLAAARARAPRALTPDERQQYEVPEPLQR